mmetsp:Transcript_27205/g.49108  ORF Transcript_27205/g.49108 Transcript_27205/m.49108 type:complete len:132 (+) Transcript_27205:279-674(+)
MPIQCVAVFNATSIKGEAVIKGLLADTRKQYMISACICTDGTQDDSKQAQELEALDPEHITIHYVNLDDLHSCVRALTGAEGAFVVTDFYPTHRQLTHDSERGDQEERHARVVVDACAASGSVKHEQSISA